MYDVTDQAAGFTVIAVSLAWPGLGWAGAHIMGWGWRTLDTRNTGDGGGNLFPATWPLLLLVIMIMTLHTQLPVTDLKIVRWMIVS